MGFIIKGLNEADSVPSGAVAYKSLFKKDWLTVNQGIHDGKIHIATANDSVMILPYRKEGDGYLFLLRLETPASYLSGGLSLTSITGTLPSGKDPMAHAALELEEESGYSIPVKSLKTHGFCVPSKLVSTRVFMFSVQIPSSVPKHKAKGDGSADETLGSCAWFGWDDLLKRCLCPLPLLVALANNLRKED